MKKILAEILILVLAALMSFAVFAGSELPRVPVGDDVYTYERKEPTCTEDGYYLTLLNGKVVSKKTIPATGHSFENDICTSCGASKYITGDIDKNGEIDVNDVTIFLRFVANWNGVVLASETLADVDGNSELDANDVTTLSRIVANWNGEAVSD